MIDLHCHILPGVDDGAKDLAVSLEMARMAVADGISIVACTPHIMPGVYNNAGDDIRRRTDELRNAIARAGIKLMLVAGADVHIAPDVVAGLRDGRVLSLHSTRYFLFEPPHHVVPPRLEEHVFNLQAANFVPILTHPERLTWIERSYDLVVRMAQGGMLIQLTAGSLTGAFGRRPLYWAERILDEGLCSVLATDAHNVSQRPPLLSKARDCAAKRLGDEEASNLVQTRPLCILKNEPPNRMPDLPKRRVELKNTTESESKWTSVFDRVVRAINH